MAGGHENGVQLRTINNQPPNNDDSDLSTESVLPAIRVGKLKTFDVFSLIVNKMIGTGIYSAPATVLLLTGNKSLTLGLFAIGFLYSIGSMFMYLDYAAVLPYTGGELVYLDEITAVSTPPEISDPEQRSPSGSVSSIAPPSQSQNNQKKLLHRVFGDGLLAYVVYSLLFIGIFNSGTNSMQTGRMILLCIQASPGQSAPDLNRDLIRFIGVVTLTILCLIQYFSAEAGRKLNRYLAVLKIIFLFILIVAGGVKAREVQRDTKGNPVDMANEWHRSYDVKSKVNFAKGLLAVLFSFEGWENATFVAGEIPPHRQHVLRKGFMFGVVIVGVLYLCVTSVFLDAIPYDSINGVDGKGQNVNYSPMFFGNGPSAKRAWAILAALSSLGSLNSIIYTFSRVKQAIGQANILPWSKIWRKDDLMHRDDADDLMHKSPQGGLLLHWIMSVVVIAGSSSIKNTVESVSLPGYVQTYSHCFILMILSAGFLRLPSREGAIDHPDRAIPEGIWRPSQTTGLPRVILGVILFLYGLTNLTLLVVNVIPPYRASDGTNVAFKGFGFPAILSSIVLFGFVYYVLVFGAATWYYPAGRPVDSDDEDAYPATPSRESGLLDPNHFWARLLNIPSWARVRIEIRKDYYYNTNMGRVYRFGRRWRIRWILDRRYRARPSSSEPQAVNGNCAAENSNDSSPDAAVDHVNFLYWLFGGSRWLNQTPWQRLENKWRCVKDWVYSFLP